MAVPSNTSPPTVSGVSRIGHTLTGGNGTWTDSPSSYAYQWQRAETVRVAGQYIQVVGEGYVTTGWNDITGETASTYIVQNDASFLIRLEVIATNGEGSSAPAYSVDFGPISGNGPGGSLNGALTASLIGALGFVDDDEGE